jgi:pimeloyl-[acyl-carrier protein] methyl ester esterase
MAAADSSAVVLLHGWALHGGLLEPLAARLRGAHRVFCPDLPGHGSRPFSPPFRDLAGLAAAVAADLPPACTLVGWSLGGLVAARLAAQGCPAVRRLVLLSSTPRFVSGDGWEHGLAPGLVADFAAELEHDYHGLVRRFLALQARGDDRQGESLRQLRAAVFARGEPDPAALRAGLEVLLEADLRREVAAIAVPTLVVAGEHDRLTPAAASAWLAAAIPGARLERVAGAGHAPFLSQPEAVGAALSGFVPAGDGA